MNAYVAFWTDHSILNLPPPPQMCANANRCRLGLRESGTDSSDYAAHEYDNTPHTTYHRFHCPKLHSGATQLLETPLCYSCNRLLALQVHYCQTSFQNTSQKLSQDEP